MTLFRRTPQVVRPQCVGMCAFCYGGVYEDEPRASYNGALSPKGTLHLHLKCKPYYVKSIREAIDSIDDGVFG